MATVTDCALLMLVGDGVTVTVGVVLVTGGGVEPPPPPHAAIHPKTMMHPHVAMHLNSAALCTGLPMFHLRIDSERASAHRSSSHLLRNAKNLVPRKFEPCYHDPE
jgi:hypothetical protein